MSLQINVFNKLLSQLLIGFCFLLFNQQYFIHNIIFVFVPRLELWVWIPLIVRCTRYINIRENRRGNQQVCQWLAEGQWFAQGTPVSSTNKTDRHDIAEILLKMVLSIITITNKIGSGFLMPYVMIFFFCQLKWDVIVCFVDIGRIVNHHY